MDFHYLMKEIFFEAKILWKGFIRKTLKKKKKFKQLKILHFMSTFHQSRSNLTLFQHYLSYTIQKSNFIVKKWLQMNLSKCCPQLTTIFFPSFSQSFNTVSVEIFGFSGYPPIKQIYLSGSADEQTMCLQMEQIIIRQRGKWSRICVNPSRCYLILNQVRFFI